MLTFILAESELELIPGEIQAHKVIKSSAKKRDKKPARMILDSNYHHRAMNKIPEHDRRGRPDIVHLFLLTTLESITNKEGELRVIIHTRNNEAIYVDSKTRIMRNYDRFIGLMEKLFEKKQVPDGREPLLKLEPGKKLEDIISDEKNSFIITLSEKGRKEKTLSYFQNLKKQNQDRLTCVIGGFPRRDFHSDVTVFSNDMISLYEKKLASWSVASELLVNYENVFL